MRNENPPERDPLVAVSCVAVQMLGAIGRPATGICYGPAAGWRTWMAIISRILPVELKLAAANWVIPIAWMSNLGGSTSSALTVYQRNWRASILKQVDIHVYHGDLDLVITSRLRHRLVGVWINDG